MPPQTSATPSTTRHSRELGTGTEKRPMLTRRRGGGIDSVSLKCGRGLGCRF